MDETKNEPTTADLFETLRGHADTLRDEGYTHSSQEAHEHLSELERRMGAMARAAKPLLALVRGECGPVGRAMADTLDAALTDAPPVFTLEEVENALVHIGFDDSDIVTVKDELATLRHGK